MKKYIVRQTLFKKPYEIPRKGNRKRGKLASHISAANQKAGWYLIKSVQSGNIIYVGSSLSNLKKTIIRHFQEWNDSKFDRKVYNPSYYTVSVIYAVKRAGEEEIVKVEKELIKKYKPRDNKDYSIYNRKYMYEKKESKDIKKEIKEVDFYDGEEAPF